MLDPFALLRLPLMAFRALRARVGLKWILASWVASTLGIVVYEVVR